MNKENISAWFMGLQDRICAALEAADGGAKFVEDKWEREAGGGGRTRIIQNGDVIAKGGVAFSAVYGPTPEKIIQALQVGQADFFATGVSIVLHPDNPMVPIIHMNVRYFEMSDGTRWFGGGIDLTPHYVDEADARYFHTQLKAVCDRHNPAYYPQFKAWADDYFFNKHRNETRGIGGIFFDRLSPTDDVTLEQLFEFVKDVGELFAPVYTYFMNKNKNMEYGDRERHWQSIRRGRYVEFNLVYDKGTKFGLDTNGRTESILMSMPPQAEWVYNFQPPQGSAEQNTLNWLRKGIKWFEPAQA